MIDLYYQSMAWPCALPAPLDKDLPNDAIAVAMPRTIGHLNKQWFHSSPIPDRMAHKANRHTPMAITIMMADRISSVKSMIDLSKKRAH